MREKFTCEEDLPTLDASSRADDTPRLQALKRNHFIKESIQSIAFSRDLKGNLPTSVLPEGYFIRPLKSETELDDYVALHQSVFESQQMTLEFRQAILSGPDYDPELDLVVEAPDGKLAGFCVCQIFKSENEITGEPIGWTDPIGVHPDFRRLGLAKGLLSFGLASLKKRGMLSARLDTSSENHRMIALAQVMGFRETGRRLWFSKEI